MGELGRRSMRGEEEGEEGLTHEDDVVAVLMGFGGLDGQLAVLGRVDIVVLSLPHVGFQ